VCNLQSCYGVFLFRVVALPPGPPWLLELHHREKNGVCTFLHLIRCRCLSSGSAHVPLLLRSAPRCRGLIGCSMLVCVPICFQASVSGLFFGTVRLTLRSEARRHVFGCFSKNGNLYNHFHQCPSFVFLCDSVCYRSQFRASLRLLEARLQKACCNSDCRSLKA